MSGGSPHVSWATTRPVPGPSVSPVIPCPAAIVTLRHRVDVPMIGTPSGVTGRSPAHRWRTSNVGSSRTLPGERFQSLDPFQCRCRVEVVQLEPRTETELVADRGDGDVMFAQQQRPLRAELRSSDRHAEAAGRQHRHALTEEAGDRARPRTGGEDDVPGADVTARRLHSGHPVSDRGEADDVGTGDEVGASEGCPADQLGEHDCRADAAVVGKQHCAGDRLTQRRFEGDRGGAVDDVGGDSPAA